MSGMSGAALNAASVGFVVLSLLLCPFEHPTTLEKLSFHSPLPPDLAALVERLRAGRGS